MYVCIDIYAIVYVRKYVCVYICMYVKIYLYTNIYNKEIYKNRCSNTLICLQA